MTKSVSVVDVQGNHWHLHAQRRHLGIGEASSNQGLNPGFFQLSHIGPVPHHTRVISVLRQHTLLQPPRRRRKAVRQLFCQNHSYP